MATLETVRRRRHRLDELERQAVRELRAAGTSWHKIGVTLGLTSEGARRKFRDL